MVTEVDGEDGVTSQTPFSAEITIFNLGKKLGAWQCTIKISIAYKLCLFQCLVAYIQLTADHNPRKKEGLQFEGQHNIQSLQMDCIRRIHVAN